MVHLDPWVSRIRRLRRPKLLFDLASRIFVAERPPVEFSFARFFFMRRPRRLRRKFYLTAIQSFSCEMSSFLHHLFLPVHIARPLVLVHVCKMNSFLAHFSSCLLHVRWFFLYSYQVMCTIFFLFLTCLYVRWILFWYMHFPFFLFLYSSFCM